MTNNESNTILIIDDTPSNIKILGSVLSQFDYRLAIARDGKEGIELAERLKPDLILLDIIMPEVDGFEVCKTLKSNPVTSSVPIIFLTVKRDIQSIKKGFDCGGVDYITYPFVEKELIARIQNHLKLGNIMNTMMKQANELKKVNDTITKTLAQLKRNNEDS